MWSLVEPGTVVLVCVCVGVVTRANTRMLTMGTTMVNTMVIEGVSKGVSTSVRISVSGSVFTNLLVGVWTCGEVPPYPIVSIIGCISTHTHTIYTT